MRRFGWIVMAALAGLAGCADDNALYTNPKYVPGYKPSDSSSAALAYDREHDRNQRYDWRER
jgi:hypothetical protein